MSSEVRNNILRKIRLALTHSTPIPFPLAEGPAAVFQPLQQDVVVEFAEQFTNIQGKFSFCATEAEAKQGLETLFHELGWTRIFCKLLPWHERLPEIAWTDDIVSCDASITECEALVARTGTIVLSAANTGRTTSVYAPVHVCIAYTSQLTYDLSDAFVLLKEKYPENLPSFISFATGPSRTADIEKTLVVGVHGPKEVYCFLIDDGKWNNTSR